MESTQIWYEVSIKNAVLTEIAVYSPANINLSSNTKVGTVVAAANVHFTGKGQIGTLQVKAGTGFPTGETQENPGKRGL